MLVKPQQLLILQDLDQAGFSLRKNKASMLDVMLGIKWLAYFHARFLQQDCSDLWPIGTYSVRCGSSSRQFCVATLYLF